MRVNLKSRSQRWLQAEKFAAHYTMPEVYRLPCHRLYNNLYAGDCVAI